MVSDDSSCSEGANGTELKFGEKFYFISFLTLICLIFFSTLLPRATEGTLWHTDETYTAERSREMLIAGNPFTVYLNFQPNFNKPPLQYYLTTLSLKLIPDPELAVRIWSLVYATLCLILTALLYLHLRPREWIGALFAACFCASYAYFAHNARLGLLDMGLTFYILLTLFFFFKADQNHSYYLLAGLFAGIGSWQKVPIPALIFLSFIFMKWCMDPSKEWIQDKKVFYGLLIALILSLIWPLLQLSQHPNEYLATFSHEWDRLTGAYTTSGKKHMLHAGFILLIVRKWTAFGIITLFSLFSFFLIDKLKESQKYKQLTILSMCYLGIISLFASFNKHYMIPTIPLLSITGTWFLFTLFNNKKHLLYILCIFLLGINIAIARPQFLRPEVDYSIPAVLIQEVVGSIQENEKLCVIPEKNFHESVESLSISFVLYYGRIQLSESKDIFPFIRTIQELGKLPEKTYVRGVTTASLGSKIEPLFDHWMITSLKGNYITFTAVRNSYKSTAQVSSTKE